MPRRSPQNKIGVQHERFGAIMYRIFSAAEAREAYTQRDGDMTDAELRRGLRTICWRPTAAACFDHPLSVEWSGFRDGHIRPDLVLIYEKPDAHTLRLVRLGSLSTLGCRRSIYRPETTRGGEVSSGSQFNSAGRAQGSLVEAGPSAPGDGGDRRAQLRDRRYVIKAVFEP